jgi:hypothetical protein
MLRKLIRFLSGPPNLRYYHTIDLWTLFVTV